jgi:replicative DNA helicase
VTDTLVFDTVQYLANKGIRTYPTGKGTEVTAHCWMCDDGDPKGKGKLYINTTDGWFHCKRCGFQGGTYVMQESLGDDPRSKPDRAPDPSVRRRVLNWATDVGSAMLGNNDDHMLYLVGAERGLWPETILDRRLGFIGNNWSLVQSLPEEFTKDELMRTGLVHREGLRAGKDFFYNHLLIPYVSRGTVVQVRGRHVGDAKGGKYMTGPAEDVMLYNTDDLDDATDVIITEGEFDTMILKQVFALSPEERIRNIAVVACPGAGAFKEEFVRYFSDVQRVYVGFDSDDEGRKGAIRIKEMLGTRTRIIEWPRHLVDQAFQMQLKKLDWSDYVNKMGGQWQDVLELMSTAGGKRLFSMREAGVSFRNAKNLTDGIKTGFAMLDATITPGLLPGQVMVVLAKTGCIAGDSVVKVNRGGKTFDVTMQRLHDRWNGKDGIFGKKWDPSIPTMVQIADDTDVRLSEVVDVWDSGEKPTFTVSTVGGRTVTASDEHPFLTTDGWRELGRLHVGDKVAVNVGRSANGHRARPSYSIRCGLRYHPYAGRRNVKAGGWSVPTHRLVVEAAQNGLDLNEYLRRCREGDVEGLTFLDPKVMHVHHLDHDTWNNALENLEPLVGIEHARRHAEEGTTTNVLEHVDFDEVVSIVSAGTQRTFDLSVRGEPHNYLANGFVVHNTGKTIFCCNMAYNMRSRKVLFISLEQTREEVYDRLRRIYLFWNPTATDEVVEHELANVYINDENRLAEKDLGTLIAEYEVETGERPEVVFVDYLGYFARGCRGSSQYERVTNAVMQLKADAKAQRVVLISPSQVNRIAKEGKPIDLDDARDSGAIEETADFLLSVFRPDDGVDNTEGAFVPSGRLRMGVLKSRHGGKDRTFSLQMDMLTLAIVDAESPAESKARDHNYKYGRGWTWAKLRTEQLAPVQEVLQ